MTNQQKLEALIQKAIDGGWKGVPSTSFKEGYGDGIFISGKELLTWRFELWHGTLTQGEYDDYEEIRIEAIIFNHDFAKALWGDELIESDYYEPQGNGEFARAWVSSHKYHLQQIVIADDPIDYAYQTIFGDK